MTDFTPVKAEALTSNELDRVAGGIIIVSGLAAPLHFQARLGRAQSAAAAAEGFLFIRPLIATAVSSRLNSRA